MPGWHVSTLDDQNDGRLQVLGIVQEQHPDRARLFMQWKQMNWPVMADPFNLLGVKVVPITLLIDEMGVIRKVNPSREEVSALVDGPLTHPLPTPVAVSKPEPSHEGGLVGESESAVQRALWNEDGDLDQPIERLERLVRQSPDNGVLHFQTGVAYRKRHDSPARQPGDFQSAARHWTRALELDPNQYIWRRRVQQYGPRLDKPYAFYDWVPEARKEIIARGETPVALSAEPGGAEFAAPSKEFAPGSPPTTEPDPEGRITRDLIGLIHAEVTVVPAVVKPGDTVRVHVEFRPNALLKAHWNNEVDGLAFQVKPPAGWTAAPALQQLSLPNSAVSTETRRVEFELQAPDNVSGAMTIPAYALYYVCEDVGGTCLYRRLDVPVAIAVQ